MPSAAALNYGTGLSLNLQPAAYAFSNILFILATVTICLRIYSQGWVVRSFGWDDWTMTSILGFNAGQHTLLMIFMELGSGLHTTILAETAPEKLRSIAKILFVEEIYYVFMQFIIKQCILLFYLRLSPQRNFVLRIYATMGWNAATTLAIWLIYCLQCQPLPAFWGPAIKGKCLPTLFLYFFPASLDITTDLIIFILPLPTLFRLQTSLRRRLAVMSIMSVGGIAIFVSCLRLIVLYDLAANPDLTYLLGKMVIVSAAEIETMIIAANIPSFKPLWVQTLGFTAFWDSSAPNTQKQPDHKLTHTDCKPKQDLGLDTELELHDPQDELCAATAAKDRQIQVTTDLTITTDENPNSASSEEVMRRQKVAYYDIGSMSRLGHS